MLKNESIETDYGTIYALVYMCDYCSTTTSEAYAGPEWIHISSINPNISTETKLNHHFCQANHAVLWHDEIYEYLTALGKPLSPPQLFPLPATPNS